MLTQFTDAAQRLLRNTEIRGNITQGYPFDNMRRLLQQVMIQLGRCFKLGIDIAFFQPDIILFIHDAHQAFDFVVLVKQAVEHAGPSSMKNT